MVKRAIKGTAVVNVNAPDDLEKAAQTIGEHAWHRSELTPPVAGRPHPRARQHAARHGRHQPRPREARRDQRRVDPEPRRDRRASLRRRGRLGGVDGRRRRVEGPGRRRRSPTDLDAVIVATCTMSKPIPNAAAQTADRIGVNGTRGVRRQHRLRRLLLRRRHGRRHDPLGHRAPRAGDRLGEALRLAGHGRPLDRDHLRRRGRRRGGRPGDHRGRGRRRPGRLGQRRATSSSTIHIDETDALRQEGQAVFRWATTKIAPVALRGRRGRRA